MPVNAEQQASVQSQDDRGALDVHALMSSVTLRSPEGMVVVRGMVQKLRYAPNPNNPEAVYGDLRDLYDNSVLSFRCPAAAAPEIDKPAVLRGTLRTKVSRFHGGFDLELVGRKVGGWTPEARGSSSPVPIRRERPKLPLARLIAKDPVKRIIFLGTELGIADAKHTLIGSPGAVPETKVVPMTVDALQKAVLEAAPSHSAICLLRGGGDPQLFQAFNDSRLIASLLACGVPFYTAVGHATDLTLADKYADESFVTPSALGSSYAEACKAQAASETLQRHARQLETEIQDLKAEMARRVRSARQLGLEESVSALTRATASLQQLPTDLERQASKSLAVTFRQPMQDLMTAVQKRARWNAWSVLFLVFLGGALAGGYSYHIFEMTRINQLQGQLEQIQQQTAPDHGSLSSVPSGKLPHRK